jgi:NADH/NAD ratio-sensing transcriptional regulator Rex
MRELFRLNEDIRDFERVILYGGAAAGKAVFLRLLQHNIKVNCFADSDPEKCGQKHLNIPIVHIDELADWTDAAVVVCGAHAFTVAKELKKRGFRHLFYDCANDIGILHLERKEDA